MKNKLSSTHNPNFLDNPPQTHLHEQTLISKKKKSRVTQSVPIRVKFETKQKLVKDLSRINKDKTYGRKINIDSYLQKAISLIKKEHIHELIEASLSNQDRLQQLHEAYNQKHGAITRDEFLGKLLIRELETPPHLPAKPLEPEPRS